MKKKIHISTVMNTIAILLIVGWICMLFIPSEGHGESYDTVQMYVLANRLNGRARPSKKANKEALFDHGDCIYATGEWSKDYHWVEIIGGETGTVWCDIRYLTERKKEFTVRNNYKTPVKIRKFPVKGRISGYLRKGKTLVIDQVVLGWGHCELGWVDLYYVEEE